MLSMLGQTFGRLTVLQLSHRDKRDRKYFLCKCSCGNEKTVQGALLRSGNTKSCGCLGAEARKSKRLPNNLGVITQILLQYKRHARTRGLSFELTKDEFAELVQKPCFYCGIEWSNVKTTKNFREGFRYNGIDRINSGCGYYSTNVVPSCKQCNLAKRDLTTFAFFDWAKRVSEHHNNRAVAANLD